MSSWRTGRRALAAQVSTMGSMMQNCGGWVGACQQGPAGVGGRGALAVWPRACEPALERHSSLPPLLPPLHFHHSSAATTPPAAHHWRVVDE
jgi:hypothetical protein